MHTMKGGTLMDFLETLTAWACHLNSALPCVFCRRLHLVGLWQRPKAQLLTQTFIGRIPSGPGPGSVLVKWVTSLAVGSHCVMLAGTDQATMFPFNTLTGVTVTLTSEGNIDRYLCKGCKYNFSCTLSRFSLADSTVHVVMHYEWVELKAEDRESEKAFPP